LFQEWRHCWNGLFTTIYDRSEWWMCIICFKHPLCCCVTITYNRPRIGS
jgi:hypothetical protein